MAKKSKAGKIVLVVLSVLGLGFITYKLVSASEGTKYKNYATVSMDTKTNQWKVAYSALKTTGTRVQWYPATDSVEYVAKLALNIEPSKVVKLPNETYMTA